MERVWLVGGSLVVLLEEEEDDDVDRSCSGGSGTNAAVKEATK